MQATCNKAFQTLVSRRIGCCGCNQHVIKAARQAALESRAQRIGPCEHHQRVQYATQPPTKRRQARVLGATVTQVFKSCNKAVFALRIGYCQRNTNLSDVQQRLCLKVVLAGWGDTHATQEKAEGDVGMHLKGLNLTLDEGGGFLEQNEAAWHLTC